MNIVKVSVTAETGQNWTGLFNGVPTVEKLREVVETPFLIGSKDSQSLLQVAELKPAMLTEDFVCWFSSIIIAGTQVGVIKYRKIAVFPLEESEEVKGFTNMSSQEVAR